MLRVARERRVPNLIESRVAKGGFGAKSAIAHRKSKICQHASTMHAQFQTLSARTSARTSHVWKCDNTHMCAATQHLIAAIVLNQFLH